MDERRSGAIPDKFSSWKAAILSLVVHAALMGCVVLGAMWSTEEAPGSQATAAHDVNESRLSTSTLPKIQEKVSQPTPVPTLPGPKTSRPLQADSQKVKPGLSKKLVAKRILPAPLPAGKRTVTTSIAKQRSVRSVTQVVKLKAKALPLVTGSRSLRESPSLAKTPKKMEDDTTVEKMRMAGLAKKSEAKRVQKELEEEKLIQTLRAEEMRRITGTSKTIGGDT